VGPVHSGRFIKAFSYSGPNRWVGVQNAQNGTRIYVDGDALLSALPAALRGADYVEASDADKLYIAADLMEIAVNAGTVVSVAHDNRLPRPGWLGAQFKPTGLVLTIGGKPMQVFQHVAVGEESLTLGANAESGGVKDCNMYVVFVSPAASR
jgi:beta-galactosidase